MVIAHAKDVKRVKLSGMRFQKKIEHLTEGDVPQAKKFLHRILTLKTLRHEEADELMGSDPYGR